MKQQQLQIARARLAEAKRALRLIAHHINCPEAGQEPESCWRGNSDQPACLRIYQHRRIRYLQKQIARLDRHRAHDIVK